MKKLIGAFLTLTMTAASFTGVFAAKNKFTDISDVKYEWAKKYIEEMADAGYINGYEDGTYRPDNQVTRLETIVLFARAMGSGRDENKDALELAADKYGETVDILKLNFGNDEIAYMLYRGALSEEDLKTYLSKDKANKPMPRQEAAAIITKALCGEEEAKSEVLTDMEYTDTKLIDPDYTQYVWYASDNGIMNGMEDGSFSPDTSVLRSQIAVMLHRSVEKMALYMESPLIEDVDYDKKNFIFKSEGEEIEVGFDDDTRFYLNGEISDSDKFVAGTTPMITYINEKTVYIDMQELVPEETVKVVFKGTRENEDGTEIKYTLPGDSEEKSYKLAKKATFFKEDGSSALIRNFSSDSYVELQIANDTVISMSLLKKDEYISGAVVESVDIEDDLYLTITHTKEEYNGMKFKLNDEVAVYKNDDVEDLSKIYKGDRIDITLECGIVTKLKATSNTERYDGSIDEIIISSTSSIKVKINDTIRSFDILPTTVIVSNGEDATLYDLRVKDHVKVTTESGALLRIETTTPAVSATSITGVVEVINTSKGFIKVDGETIFCNDSTTILTASGTKQNLKQIKEGATVTIRGSLQNGAYTASLIIIED